MFVILCKCGLLPIAGFSPRSSSYDMEGSVGNVATVQNVLASKDDTCLSFFYLLLCFPVTRSFRISVLGASNFSNSYICLSDKIIIKVKLRKIIFGIRKIVALKTVFICNFFGKVRTPF
jgi:hypothetical protein